MYYLGVSDLNIPSQRGKYQYVQGLEFHRQVNSLPYIRMTFCQLLDIIVNHLTSPLLTVKSVRRFTNKEL